MTIYLIQAQKQGGLFCQPELSASRYASELRKLQLEKQGMTVTIDKYEVKTQGVNFNSISQSTGLTFNIG